VRNAQRFSTIVLGFAVVAVLLLSSAAPAVAKPTADPFEYVGAAGDCSPGWPAGAKVVTAIWLRGLGLTDNGADNFNEGDPRDLPSKSDRHEGLLLSKNGPSPVCSAPGARISNFARIDVTESTELGFDIRNGTACGAGAPRFNVTVRVEGVDQGPYFVGCAAGAKVPAPQDPTEWTRVRINLVTSGVPTGSRVRSITLIHDEGTDTTTPDNPGGVGLSILDNIYINGEVIPNGPGN
jgi:hypothetical protein